MHLTIKIVMWIGATPGCSGCAGSRSHTEACRVQSRRTLADAKESEISRAVGAGVGSIKKMTVELQQPTAVMQQEPSTIVIFQSYCADAKTDTKHSERADGFTDGNGSTGEQRAKESATE